MRALCVGVCGMGVGWVWLGCVGVYVYVCYMLVNLVAQIWEENDKGKRSDSLSPVQSKCTTNISVRSHQTLTMPNVPIISFCDISRACGCEMLPSSLMVLQHMIKIICTHSLRNVSALLCFLQSLDEDNWGILVS